jgi:hypothetical protein
MVCFECVAGPGQRSTARNYEKAVAIGLFRPHSPGAEIAARGQPRICRGVKRHFLSSACGRNRALADRRAELTRPGHNFNCAAGVVGLFIRVGGPTQSALARGYVGFTREPI